jgi:hypothetical protein
MRIFQKQDLSVCRKGTCDFLGSVVPAIVQLDPARVSMVNGFLHTLRLGIISSAPIMNVTRLECAE